MAATEMQMLSTAAAMRHALSVLLSIQLGPMDLRKVIAELELKQRDESGMASRVGLGDVGHLLARSKYDFYARDDGARPQARARDARSMLASILIRIALSDVFGGQCSILALDEPTTNLDVQKLIIITHDERFVSTLRRHARPEIIYHVAKDVNGKSRLTQERMNA
ncbi:unnamed protein product, partial [Mesorhabditis spiculigera]